jgi:probable HAF family extracellular repeat protein
MRKNAIFAPAVALFGMVAAYSSAQAGLISYSFTDVYPPGTQPGTIVGNVNYGMNNFGQVVGAYEDNTNSDHGYIYTRGKYVTFDVPGSAGTSLNGINDLGEIVGYYSNRGGQTAKTFIYYHGKITNIADSGSFSPQAVNDKGQILGFSPVTFTGNPAVYSNGVFSPLPSIPGAALTKYSDLNNLGQFVGYYFDSAGTHGFVERNGVFTTINDPAAGAAGFTNAFGINDWGQIVGNYCDSTGACHGFLDTNGHFTDIDNPNAVPGSTVPELVNDVEQVFGYYEDSAGNWPSFLATPRLDLFALSAADPVSDAVPEASTWAMLLLGFGGLSLVGFRRRRGRAIVPILYQGELPAKEIAALKSL